MKDENGKLERVLETVLYCRNENRDEVMS